MAQKHSFPSSAIRYETEGKVRPATTPHTRSEKIVRIKRTMPQDTRGHGRQTKETQKKHSCLFPKEREGGGGQPEAHPTHLTRQLYKRLLVSKRVRESGCSWPPGIA